MKSLSLKVLALTVTTLMSASCLHAADYSEEELAGLGVALTKVSATLHTAVRYKNPPAGLKDGELLAFATSHNPSLLNKFDGYILKARNIEKKSSILVCDKDGTVALVEDAGCTAKLDQYTWTITPNSPCDYTLDLAKVCAAP